MDLLKHFITPKAYYPGVNVKICKGKHAIAISDRSGAQFPYREMVKDGMVL